MAINPVQTFQQVVSLELGAEKKVERSYAQANKLAGIFDTCIWGQAATPDDSIPAKEAHELCDELRSIRGVYIYDSKKLKTTGQKVSHFFKRFFTVIFRKYVDVSKYSEITPVLERYVTEQRGPQKSDQPGTILRIGQAIGIVRPEGPSVEELQKQIDAMEGTKARLERSLDETSTQLRQITSKKEELEQSSGSLREENERIRRQMDEISKQISELRSELQETKTLLEQRSEELARVKVPPKTPQRGQAEPARTREVEEQAAELQRIREELGQKQLQIEKLTKELRAREPSPSVEVQMRELERTLCLQSREALFIHERTICELSKKEFKKLEKMPDKKDKDTIYFEERDVAGLPFVRIHQPYNRPKEYDPRITYTIFTGLSIDSKKVCWVVQNP